MLIFISLIIKNSVLLIFCDECKSNFSPVLVGVKIIHALYTNITFFNKEIQYLLLKIKHLDAIHYGIAVFLTLTMQKKNL